MQPNVPPNFLRVIDAVRADEELQVIIVLRKTFERVGNSCARETLEHFQSITFEARVASDPEGRVGRERVNVWQKISRLVHDVNRSLAMRNADMHMQTKNEIGPRDLLHVFDDFLVTLAFGDELIVPMRKRM